MAEHAPRKGCTERHPACHDSCEKYKEWVERYHAEQKHFEDNRYQIGIPGSYARDRRGRFNQVYGKEGRKFKTGGMQ